MEKTDELMENLKASTGGWEEEIFSFACSLARALAENILERLDAKLMEKREEGLEVVASKEYRVQL